LGRSLTTPGVWNPAKQGCYRSNNARTLNWVSNGTYTGTLGTAVFSRTIKGTETYLIQKGWYYIELVSGLGGGNGGSGYIGNNGGIPNIFFSVEKMCFIEKQMELTIKVGGNGYRGGNGGAAIIWGAGGGGESSSIIELNLDTGEPKGGNGQGGFPGLEGSSYVRGGGGGGAGIISGKGGQVNDYYNGYDGNNSTGGKGGNDGGRGGTSGGDGGNGADGGDGWNIGPDDLYGGGGGGGGMGLHGRYRPDGEDAAGYCNIYKLEN
jgi:hypothetical protein